MSLSRSACTPTGPLTAPAERVYTCQCGKRIRPVPTRDRLDYQWADESGATTVDTAPDRWAVRAAAAVAMSDPSTPPDVSHAAASSYTNLAALTSLAPAWWLHVHHPIAQTADPATATPWCCDDPMWAGPDGWVCRITKRSFPYTQGETMTEPATLSIDPCTHPADALSVLQDGATQFCTACQSRVNAPAAPVVYEPPARMWGDEADPLPQAPTVLVASTDPYVNTDGEGAREYAPKPALDAAKHALAGGWRYQYTYAAASVPERGEPGKRGHKAAHVLHTIALRLARDTETIPEGEIVTFRERGFAIWAREDAITEPVTPGKWAWVEANINGRAYGARELSKRLLMQGRDAASEPAPEAPEPAAPAAVAATPTPIAPVVPGSWGSLHVGAIVTGANLKAYTVHTIVRTGQWLGAGQPEVRVTLTDPDGGQLVVTKSAIEPATIAELSPNHEAAEMLAAAFNITEETTVTEPAPDLFSEPAQPTAPGSTGLRAEAPHGKWGWYKLTHPETGDVEALWPRVSTITKTHADGEGLNDWKVRMAMRGLSVSPDLIAMVASLDMETDKGKFREAADQAHARAATKAGANFGTAVDRFSERIDEGETVESMGVPTDLRREIEAYARTLREHGLRVIPELSQRTTLNVTEGYAGSWDRVVEHVATGDRFMLDVKRTKPDARTGLMSSYSWLEYVSQIAAYVKGEYMCKIDYSGYEPMPKINQNKGLLLHIVPGTGRAELYGVRIDAGWRNFRRSIETRKDRAEAKSSGWSWLIERPRTITGEVVKSEPAPEPAMPATAETAPSVHLLVAADIAAATTTEALGVIFNNAAGAGVWSDSLATMALYRSDQLRAMWAPDLAAIGALWNELHPLGRWTGDIAACADARAAELSSV